MPGSSAFNSTRFSSRPSHQELIYREMAKALGNGENYTEEFDSLVGARLYATAMLCGRCKYLLERSGSQFHPRKALELLPALESEYGIFPVPGSSIEERRSELAVATRIARGARRSNVEAVFNELLGSDFVEYKTIAPVDSVQSTANPPDTGVYDAPGTPRSVFRLVDPVATFSPTKVLVDILVNGDSATTPLRAGQRFIIDTEHSGRTEAVEATAVTYSGNALLISATFTKPHDAGTLLATGRHPNVSSSKRHNLLVLSGAAAADAKTRKRVNRTAKRVFRGVSTWSVADSSGPFRVGVGRLGITTIGAV